MWATISEWEFREEGWSEKGEEGGCVAVGNIRTFTSHSGDSPVRSLTSVHHCRLPCRPWPASSNHCNWRERRAGTHHPPLPSLTCKHCAIPSNATNYHPAQLPGLNLWLRRRGMSADSAPAELLLPEHGMRILPPLVDVWLPQEWGWCSQALPSHITVTPTSGCFVNIKVKYWSDQDNHVVDAGF